MTGRDLHYFDEPRQQKWRIPVLFEDEALLVFNKPAGLPVIPERWHPEWPCLRSIAETRLARPLFVVHRIDSGTSGLVVLAKSEASHRALSLQFEQHHVEKTYLAIVRGEMVEEALTVQRPLAEHPNRPGVMIVARDGKPAITAIRVLERFRGATLLEVQPQTGRQHQIRVHLQALGHPLLVDPLYGEREAFFLSSIKAGYHRNAGETEPPLIKRLTLHASTLLLHHPLSREQVGFTAPAPRDFQAVLKSLRKYAARGRTR
ncbi:MAG: RluA family pseudouridine synthase [candidate division KSB1 bacterium]|nr:RluA family pseudouridine synthase [candidate division KSB1 bacterium]MDZ7275518.1 RluA family pseudouridine synthase [candidate division KSB1 bacterium]MDZ7286170.1 RluA family pseudouridine synthase [candidate division KSB1 bacterium]MDZ7296396.1 RluA family pseudouridine synthase [candidate division KSB1 bacterium]MDZ7306231.1 RluA family pseudouridine synthase [candidate division KSB1 bacterium]